jgi:glucosamine--fructose-6-phosphate aminotransferase (isomerizing)
MCGIVGYVGKKEAAPILIEGLSRLEYRGYDSAGAAVIHQNRIGFQKAQGRLALLEQKLAEHPLPGTVGIGHTRWATHGEPSEINSHPHLNGAGTLAVVHNGIIENFQELRSELQAAGHRFLSETDTETLPHLITACREHSDSLREALCAALQRARGAYALGIVAEEDPDTLYCARLGSPLIIGLSDAGEYFIASDVPAIVNRIDRVIYLNDGEVAALNLKNGIQIFKLDGTAVAPEIQPVEMQSDAADKAGFETYMLKEIHEQPRVIRALVDEHLNEDGELAFPELPWSPGFFQSLERIMIVACGTAYHAGLYGRLLIENLTNIAVEVDLASEFRYRNPRISAGTLIIPVSQSGETADTLASIRMAKERGCKIMAICNVPGSSIVRESDAVIYTQAGPEIGVASTKAYTTQQTVFAMFATFLGKVRREIEAEFGQALTTALQEVPDAIHATVKNKALIQQVADKHHDGASSLYLGRKYNYPTALEGALKNKEISYQHAEGYAAGEMKHGPIALINEYLPVICICTRTRDEVYEKTISNIKEVEARHGRIIMVANEGDSEAAALAEDILPVPEIMDELAPIVNVTALQLLAYYAAQARGTDIDKPRNLAKSVTVE